MHCGIWDRCIVGFVRLIYCYCGYELYIDTVQCHYNMVNFYPRLVFGLRVLSLPASVSVSVCVCPSLNQDLVHAITFHPFKPDSPNLDQKCKTPFLRSLLFGRLINFDLQGQILPHFELVHAITHHLFKLGFPNLHQKCILALLRSWEILVLIETESQCMSVRNSTNFVWWRQHNSANCMFHPLTFQNCLINTWNWRCFDSFL